MNIVDWFDPYDIKHMEAYKYLERNGYWPENFIPDSVELSSVWQIFLVGAMARCWLKHVEAKAKMDEVEYDVARISKLISLLFDEINHLGNEHNIQQALAEVLAMQHRTLQQGWFRNIIVSSINIFAEKLASNSYDLRNEASCTLAKRLLPAINETAIPFI